MYVLLVKMVNTAFLLAWQLQSSKATLLMYVEYRISLQDHDWVVANQ